ncbi:lipoprotein-releasing system permease protein [Salegentibacter sp. 24]|uniref:ABC transporter permease n=1 Tax=Salegentibacter sp. 24 TaxID=2183986 RepID=UPI001060AB30|nr:ABC transporter permease [Salegentibacter sp. 24]TDN83482.1 lipoprotein-releasing system permease protein [Salegentibacter sp. 24]
MKFPFYIASRYLFSKSSNNAINIITIIAAIGVFAGAFSLFIVLSGFAGLKDFSLSFSNKFDPDLKILPISGKTFQFPENKAEKLSDIEGVSEFSKIIEERIFLDFRNKNHTAFIKGVDKNYRQVNQIDSAVSGSWLTNSEAQVVVGNTISRKLGLSIFNYQSLLNVMVPRPGKGQITGLNPGQAFNQEKVIVSGIYSINEELDDKYVFSNLNFAQNLLELDENTYSSIEIKITPNADADAVTTEIEKLFGNEVIIKNRAQLNEVLYKMLNTENLAVYLIFTLVLIIALFNVAGSIIMVILDKRNNIKTLFSLGASERQIKKIFFTQGMLMTIIGGAIGLSAAILLVYMQLQFDLVMITPSLPYPVAITIDNILIVIFTIGILGLIASFIAAGSSRQALKAI